jgi:hypothetical protein
MSHLIFRQKIYAVKPVKGCRILFEMRIKKKVDSFLKETGAAMLLP